MSPAIFFRIQGWLIRDTFRQSVASSACWIVLLLTGLTALLCASVSIRDTGPLRYDDDMEIREDRGEIAFGFGAFRVGLFRDRERAVHLLHVVLAKWGAGTVGLLLALIWTAGFLPSFLEPSSAAVLFAKPVPRWQVLLGKSLGVFVFVALQGALFVFGSWAALGLRTGVWLPGYLACLPLFLVGFAVLYSFSLMLAVWTRSAPVCVFGSIFLWLLCLGMNYGRHAAAAMEMLEPTLPPLSPVTSFLVEAGYWALPKPADLGILLDNAMRSAAHFPQAPEYQYVQQQQLFHPLPALLSSLAFAGTLFALAARQLKRLEY